MEERPRPKPIDAGGSESIWRPEEGAAATVEGPAVDRGRRRRRSRSSRRRASHRRTTVLIVVAVGLLALIADAGYVAAKMAASLDDVRTSLGDGRSALRAGQIDQAAAELEQALDSARAADGLRNHPAFWIASPVPDVEAVAALVDASELAARAGLEAITAARTLAVEDGDFTGSLYENGRVRLDAIAEATPEIEQIDGLLEEAVAELDDLASPYLGPVEDALARGQREVRDAAETARKGSALFAALPGLFGEDGPRRYLMAFQASGEARATGGLVGYFGILEAAEGRLRLVESAPTEILPSRFPAVDAPRWFASNYAAQSALNQTQQVNVSPNFPVVAEVLLEMFETLRGESLDGVIAMDPITMSHLMEATGPITVPGSDGPVTADEIVELLLHDSYVEFETARQQDVYLGALIDAFWARIRRGGFEGATLAEGVGASVSGQHLKMYSRDADEQSALAVLEADGLYSTAGPNVQMVFNNNYGANKVDYFLHRTVDTDVELTATGGASVATSITMRNEAPAGPPSLLLGPDPLHRRDEPGMNRMIVNVLLPDGAEAEAFRRGSDVRDPFVYFDDGHPVVWDSLNIPAGRTAEMGVDYDVPAAVAVEGDGATFTMTLYPQATVNDDEYRLRVTAPPGFQVRAAGTNEPLRSAFRSSGVLDRPRVFTLELVPR